MPGGASRNVAFSSKKTASLTRQASASISRRQNRDSSSSAHSSIGWPIRVQTSQRTQLSTALGDDMRLPALGPLRRQPHDLGVHRAATDVHDEHHALGGETETVA